MYVRPINPRYFDVDEGELALAIKFIEWVRRQPTNAISKVAAAIASGKLT